MFFSNRACLHPSQEKVGEMLLLLLSHFAKAKLEFTFSTLIWHAEQSRCALQSVRHYFPFNCKPHFACGEVKKTKHLIQWGMAPQKI